MHRSSPPSRPSLGRWLAVVIFLGLAGSVCAQNVQFRQTSVPSGIVNQTTFPLPAAVVSTVLAPDTSTDYRFTYWTINGVRFSDPSGFATNPATFVLNGPVDAVANYVLTTQDSDADGLPDWWELRYFGNLTQGPSDNPDGDANDNAAEYAKGTSPVLANELMQGGISRRRGNVSNVAVGVGDPDYYYGGVSRRRSATITVVTNTAAYAVLQESSSPQGAISQMRVVAKGSTVNLTTPPDAYSGYRFTGWIVNGTRFDGPSQLPPIPITVLADTSAVARYILETDDTDNDGIPDWKEWMLFDSLQYDLNSDPDGDGFSLAIEQQRGYSHLAADELTMGGLSRRRSATVTVDTTGRLPFRLASDPATILEQTDYLTAGSVITVPDKSGSTFSNYRFAWWDLNGARQQDASGVAVTTFQFTLSVPSTATAHYLDPTVDTVGDGITDWIKTTYYGSLAYGAASDTDGDGFTFAQELLRGYSPRVADTLDQGGVSRRRGFIIPMNIGSSQTTVVLSPTSDFSILSESPGSHDPTYLSVYNDGGGNVRRSILQFDFSSIPSGSTINSAALTLTSGNGLSQPSGTHSDVFALAVPWDATANWTQASNGVPWTTPGGDVTGVAYATNSQVIPNGNGDPVSWDVTSLVSAWKAATLPNYGMLLAATPGDTLYFFSSGYPIQPYRPKLSITYTVYTFQQPPAVGVAAAVNITQTSARLGAQVNPARTATNIYFQWGLSETYGHQTAGQDIGAGSQALAVGADVSGLAPDTLYHFRVVASSAQGVTMGDDAIFRTAQSIVPMDPPSITSTNAVNGRNGTAFSYQITATNSPTSYGATGLPDGLSVNTTSGLISGTPTVNGIFTLTITAANRGGLGSGTVTLTLLPPPPSITSALAALGTQGGAFSYQITATNSPDSYGATGLPNGLSVNTTTGRITGTPTVSGVFNVAIAATNSGGTGSDVLTLNIPPPPPMITSVLTASGTSGIGFSYQITASNNPASYGAAGLPSGLSVNPTSGLISGTPLATGTFAVTVRASNPGGTGSETLTLTILSPQFLDLQVSSVTVDPPTGIHSGANLVIHWTDSNTGNSPTGASFNELVTVRNITTGATLLNQSVFYDQNAPGNGPIAGGDSRTRQLSMRLPDGSSGVGSLEFSVTVDSTFLIVEYADGTEAEANNTTKVNRNSTLSPYPDLQVTGLAVEPAAGVESGGQITIRWTDSNGGNGATGASFYDRVSVVNTTTGQTLTSTNLLYDPAVAGNGPIAAGGTRTRTHNFTLPDGPPGVGVLRITVATDSNGDLFEYNGAGTAETNNTAAITVTSADTKGPVLANWTYGAANFVEGMTVTLSASIGVGATDFSGVSRVEFYVRAAPGGSDTLIGTDTNGADGYQAYWNAELTTADGDYIVTLKAYDTFNNATVESRGLHLGLAPPPAPTITAPVNGSTLSREDITMTGTTLPNAQVAVYRGGQVQSPLVTASSSGSFSTPITIVDGANFLQAAARNRAGEGPRASVNVTLDRSVPSAPAALQATSRAGGVIQLSWIRPAGAIAGYNIYRASSSFDTTSQATKVNTALVTTELYNDTPVTDGTYYYRVTAVNTAQTEGPVSSLVSAVSDRVLPVATSIQYVAQGKYDSATNRFGTGIVGVTVNLSEAASSTPFLSITPLNGTPISISLQRSTDLKYIGLFVITSSTPSGAATATASIRDSAGNRGTEIQSGGTITIDASGPRIVGLAIQPSQSIKNNPSAPVQVTFTATLDSPVKAVTTPQFSSTLSNTAPSSQPISSVSPGADNLTWIATFTLPSTAGQTTENLELFFSAQDDLDNIGSLIVPPHKFQIYQGDLPGLDSPLSLTAKAKPAGAVELNWRSVDTAADYQVFRKGSTESAFTPLALSGNALTITDLPASDGTYQYTVAAVRHENGQESIGPQSNTASAKSDRVSPPPPQNLQIQVISQGIKATWEAPVGLAEAVKCRLYRAAAGIVNAELAAQDVPDLLALDPYPTSAKPYYYVTAADDAGNESPRSNAVYQNVQLLPVRTLAIRQVDTNPPFVFWSQVSGNIAGYDIYQGEDASRTKLNSGGLIAGTDFSDTAFGGSSDRRYTVVTVDNNQAQSLGRSLTLPRITATLASDAIVNRGVMNRLNYTVRNDSANPIEHIKLKVRLGGKDHYSAQFSLAAGAEQVMPVIVGGYQSLLGTSAPLVATIQIAPTDGEEVSIERSGQVPLGDGQLQVDIMPSEFLQGGSGKVQFKIANLSAEEIEITTATGSGAQPSPEVRFKLLDADGNVLVTVPYKLAIGGDVVTLPGGNTVLRLPAGFEYPSTQTLVPVPAGVPSQLFVRIEIDKIYYHQGQPDQVVLDGLQTRRAVTVTQTSYTGEITSVTPAESNGDQDIVIAGHATFRANNAPAPRVPLVVKITKDGFDRSADVFTGDDGTFTYTFKPLQGESGGFYDVWAVHPDLTDRTVQKTFLIRRVLITPAEGTLRAPRNYTQPVTLTASTGAGVAVRNLKIEYLAADQPGGTLPAGITVDPGWTIPLLDSNQSVALTANITGNTDAAQKGLLVLRVSSDESNAGGWQKVRVSYELGEASPLLRTTPGFVTTGVNPGGTVTETVTFENVGLVAVEGLTLTLLNQDGTAAPAWISLTVPSESTDLEVGQRRDVSLAFQPLASTAENDYFLILRATAGNHPPRDVNVHVAVTSAGRGNALFKVLDMFTGTLDAGGQPIQGVRNATIELQNEQVVSVQQTLVSDSAGEAAFDNLPAGSYKYRVTADKHVSTTGRLWIRPGTTVNQEVALQYNVVTIEWEVVPVTVEDRYNIVLQATFETNVPAPVVVVDPPAVNLPRMCKGDVFQGEFTITNYGLIRADNVKIPVPVSDDFFKVEMLNGIPTSVAAGEQVRVSYRMTALGDFGGNCSGAGAGGSASRTDGSGGAISSRIAVVVTPKVGSGDGDGSDGLAFNPSEPTTFAEIAAGKPCVSYFRTIPVTYTYVCSNGLKFDGVVYYTIGGQFGDCGGGGGGFGGWGGGGGGGGGGSGGGVSYVPIASGGVSCYPTNPRYGAPGFGFGQLFGAFLTNVGCSVNSLTRGFEEDITDLEVKVPGQEGSVTRVERRYRTKDWSFEETLGFRFDGSALAAVIWKNFEFLPIDATRTVFESGTTRIYKNPTVYRLETSAGAWSEFDLNGHLLGEGTKTVQLTKFLYDAGGKRTGVKDRNDNQLIWFEWTGDLLTAVRDAAGRRAEYTYTGSKLTKAKDAAGMVTQYEYNADGRLSKITDATNKSLFLVYGADGGVKSMLDEQGRGKSFEYRYDQGTGEFYCLERSSSGRVEEKWFSSGGLLREWHINGKLIERVVRDGRSLLTTDTNGSVVRDDYDEWGDLLKTTFPDGSKRTYDYDVNHHLLDATDEDGVVSRFSYDANGNITEVVQAAGADGERKRMFTYNAAGSPTSLISVGDPRTAQSVINLSYSAQGDLQSITDPLNKTEQILSRDALGRVLQRRDKNNQVWNYGYDALGRPTSATNPLNETTQYEFDAFNNVTARISPTNKRTNYEYDIQNNVVKAADPQGKEQTHTYNADGQLTGIVDREGKTQSVEYDDFGRVVKVLDGVGNQILSSYDPATASPAPSAITYPTFTRQLTYDDRRRVTKIEDVLPGGTTLSTTFTYSRAGHVLSVTDAENRTTTFTRDALGRALTATRPGEGTVRYTYDDRDNVIALTNSNGLTWQFEYDAAGQVTKETTPGAKATLFGYDNVGHLTTITAPNGAQTKRIYDAAGRLVTVKHFAPGNLATPTKTITMQRDGEGRIAGYADGTTSSSYAYDDLGRKLSEIVNYGAFSLTHSYTYYSNGLRKTYTAPDGTVYTFTYDDANRLSGVSVPGVGQITVNEYNVSQIKKITFPGGGTTNFIHDALFRPTNIKSSDAANNTQLNLNLSYSPLGNVISRDDGSGAETFQYDGARRLTHSGESTYTYDANGNRLTDSAAGPATWTYNSDDQLLSDGVNTYSYDENGAVLRKVTPTGTWNFTYDEAGRLVRAEKGANVIKYYYDPFGRRLSKEVNGIVTYYFYCVEGLCGEYDSAGNQLRRYTYSPAAGYGTPPLFVTTPAGTYFYHYDQIGTPLKLTDSVGNTVWAANYDDFGAAQVTIGLVENNLRFPGQYFDAETGLHYNWNRYYDPQSGRYLSKDPARDGTNCYVYANDNPLGFTDPDGLRVLGNPYVSGALKVIGGIGEATAGIAFGIATSWSGVGAVAGGAVALHGLDQVQAGVRQLFTGTQVDSFTSKGLQGLGLSPGMANLVDAGISIVGTAGLSYATSALSAGGNAAKETSTALSTYRYTTEGETFSHYGYAEHAAGFEGGLRPGGFGTSASDLTGAEAKAGLALPHAEPPNAVYTVTPAPGTLVRVNPVTAPQFGQPGGLPEFQFPLGTGPGTISGPKPIR